MYAPERQTARVIPPTPITVAIVDEATGRCLCYGVIADVSEVNDYHTGIRKDGSYSAITAFITKLVGSVVGYLATACLAWVGFVEGSDTQTPQSLCLKVQHIDYGLWMTDGSRSPSLPPQLSIILHQ